VSVRVVDKIRELLQTGFFHVFGGSVINKVISFLSSVVLVKLLSKAEYGVFTYSWNIYSILLVFNGMGIETGVLQLASENGADGNYVEQVNRFGTRFGLTFDVLITIALFVIGRFVHLKIQGGGELLCILCLLPEVQLLYNLTLNNLRALKKNREYAVLSLTNTTLLFLFSVISALVFREKGLVAGYYISGIISCCVGFYCFGVRLIGKSRLHKEDVSSLLRISFISMLNNGLSQMMYLLDVFVLGMVDPQETLLASYKVSTTIPAALSFIPTSLVIYIYPYFAEHKDDKEWCRRKYKHLVTAFGGLNAIISAFLCLGAPLIVRTLYGSEYLDAIPVFRILSINYFFSGTFRVISGNLLVSQRKLKFNLFVAIVSSAINVIADYYFIQWWGSIGAALATVVVVLVSSILSTSYLIFTFRKGQVGLAEFDGDK